MKNLIVYYSYEGNTEELVKAMSEVVDADILKLVPKNEKNPKVYLDLYGWKKKYI